MTESCCCHCSTLGGVPRDTILLLLLFYPWRGTTLQNLVVVFYPLWGPHYRILLLLLFYPLWGTTLQNLLLLLFHPWWGTTLQNLVAVVVLRLVGYHVTESKGFSVQTPVTPTVFSS